MGLLTRFGPRPWRLWFVVGAALLIAVVPAMRALADSSQCSVSSGTCAAKAAFTSYGEHLKVYDRAADGHSAVVLYWLSDGTGPYFGWNPNGNGSVVDIDLELPEGDWIFFKACLGEYGTKTLVSGTCSAGVTDYA